MNTTQDLPPAKKGHGPLRSLSGIDSLEARRIRKDVLRSLPLTEVVSAVFLLWMSFMPALWNLVGTRGAPSHWIVVWIPFPLTSILVYWWFRRKTKESIAQILRWENRCPGCGYSLRGTVGACPECGETRTKSGAD